MTKHSEFVPAWPNASIDLNAVHDSAKQNALENGFSKKHLLIPEVEAIPDVAADSAQELEIATERTHAAAKHRRPRTIKPHPVAKEPSEAPAPAKSDDD